MFHLHVAGIVLQVQLWSMSNEHYSCQLCVPTCDGWTVHSEACPFHWPHKSNCTTHINACTQKCVHICLCAPWTGNRHTSKGNFIMQLSSLLTLAVSADDTAWGQLKVLHTILPPTYILCAKVLSVLPYFLPYPTLPLNKTCMQL